MIKIHCFLVLCTVLLFPAYANAMNTTYTIVDTGQNECFDNSRPIACPAEGEPFYGQDAQYDGNTPRYRDNGDGTISDINTGLMWVAARGDKMSWRDAKNNAASVTVGGYTDWRMPTIKELYSLIDFSGQLSRSATASKPFIDTRYFEFAYGETSKGERSIDCQDWSSTVYKGTTMNGSATAFGVNFADGRIKGYPKEARHGRRDTRYVRYVRGNPNYGNNDFVDNGNGTVTDQATGLMWQQNDSGTTYNWEDSLAYCENLTLGGRSDWRLPNAKELQSIVDYTRSPTTTGTAAIDPIFSTTDIQSYYWTGTTHREGPPHRDAEHAVYVAFGQAMGYFSLPRSGREPTYMDVHGAGAQRSDPKAGDPADYPQGFGPQGDDRRIFNYARCVANSI
ncbi:DUF1566 domain-containing protein [Desulfovibrio inopinatus]|uniref:Lcl C-terminal domain-containing protein n=1 Tax=Desulfovibrio inopinatus TaxID=102109 RepID=UPI000410BAA2|nr:DUF1566 domain-containing protein [Desulfovibrio inopinatus]